MSETNANMAGYCKRGTAGTDGECWISEARIHAAQRPGDGRSTEGYGRETGKLQGRLDAVMIPEMR